MVGNSLPCQFSPPHHSRASPVLPIRDVASTIALAFDCVVSMILMILLGDLNDLLNAIDGVYSSSESAVCEVDVGRHESVILIVEMILKNRNER